MSDTSVMMRLGGVTLRWGDDVESFISADDFIAAAAAVAEVNGGGVFRPETKKFIQTSDCNPGSEFSIPISGIKKLIIPLSVSELGLGL